MCTYMVFSLTYTLTKTHKSPCSLALIKKQFLILIHHLLYFFLLLCNKLQQIKQLKTIYINFSVPVGHESGPGLAEWSASHRAVIKVSCGDASSSENRCLLPSSLVISRAQFLAAVGLKPSDLRGGLLFLAT